MTQFASRTPYDIIHDPEGDALIESGAFRKEEVYGLVPDKFYNPVNIILMEFRRALERYYDKRLCLHHYITYVTYGDVYGWPMDQRVHAQKVFTRLKALSMKGGK